MHSFINSLSSACASSLTLTHTGEVKDGVLRIGNTTVPVYNPDNRTKVPDILFYENPQVCTCSGACLETLCFCVNRKSNLVVEMQNCYQTVLQTLLSCLLHRVEIHCIHWELICSMPIIYLFIYFLVAVILQGSLLMCLAPEFDGGTCVNLLLMALPVCA